MRQHRFDFRSEQQPFRRHFVVQGLDAQPVARDEERFRVAIPDGKGEHAAQMLHTVRAVLFVKVNDGLGIAVRAVAVAARDELLAQGEMVVNLAIEHDPERAIFIRNRLMSARNIDNAEPSHADAQMAVRIKAFVVGPAMGDDAAHFAQSCGVCARVPSKFKNPSDSAHLVFLRVRGRAARQRFEQWRNRKLLPVRRSTPHPACATRKMRMAAAIFSRGCPCHATRVPPITTRCESFSLSIRQYSTRASEDHGPKLHASSPSAKKNPSLWS